MAGATFRQGLWRLAAPTISLTSLASMYLGIAVAAAQGHFSALWAAVTLAALFGVEVAKNAWGDVFDYDSGVDAAVRADDCTSFSGGRRVLVEDLLTRRQTWGTAIGFGLGSTLLGLAIVVLREPAALWLGLAGFALAWSYNGPPLRLTYRGLGELAVMLSYGPVIALGAYLVQTHRLSWEVFWLSLPLGIIIAGFLWVNEFPDYEADRAHGKWNLVARLGRRRASRLYPLLYLAALAVLAALPLAGLPRLVWLGALTVAPAGLAVWYVWREPETFHRARPAQPAALIAFLVYAAGAGTGVLLA